MRINNTPDTRILEQRSRLEFHYPKGDIIAFVPFYENPTITESKTANIVEYNPLGRSGSLFAYTGAKSRRIRLEVGYTLPHLLNFQMGVERFRRIVKDPEESQKRLFTQWTDPETIDLLVPPDYSFGIEKNYWRARTDTETMEGIFGDIDFITNPSESFMSFGADINTEQFLDQLSPSDKHKAIDTLVFFVNLFRTSVDNNAQNPIYGPPLIRLTHGTMYQSIPCICKSYNLSFEDEEWGYDLETLTPRKLTISLDLQEVRVGNFGEFRHAKATWRDNLTGWESVINNPLTTDPGQLI